MRQSTIHDDVRLEPGSKFPGDSIIYLFEQRFDLATVAWAMREFIQNERRRWPFMPHWQHDPTKFYVSFMVEALETEDEEAFNEVCRRYRLWRYSR